MSCKPAAEVVRELIEYMATGRYSEAADLYDDTAEIHVMFALPAPRRIAGHELKARLREATAPRSPMYRDIQCEDLRILVSDPGDVVAAEWRYSSRVPGRSDPVLNHNIIVVQVKDGKIVESRDYHDHVMRAVADGTTAELQEAIRRLA